MSTVLLVPPDGLLEILHSEDKPILPRSWLEAHGSGQYVALAITVGKNRQGTVEYLIHEANPTNSRARDVLARLTGVHVILTGNVAFTGLHPDTLVELVKEVG